jgi:hypothetical protein
MAEPLVPPTRSHYRDDRAALLSLLRGRRPDTSWYAGAVSPYPWLLTPTEVAGLGRLLGCVRRAMCAVVEHYFADPRLRALLAVSPEVEDLLRAAARRPYRPGFFRPDFLHDTAGAVRINEINARFPLNGFLISHLLDGAFREVPYRRRLPVGFDGLPTLAAVPRALREAFDGAERLLVLKGQERGWDVRLLLESWPGCREARPEDVTDPRGAADFFLLELHQHELLGRLPRATLRAILEGGRYLNDVRTIFLGHDKRLLAVLTVDVLRDYLPAEDVETLHRHVVPTYVVGLGGESLRLARSRPHEWVLKPNLLGKGEGIVVGRNVTPEAWRAALDAAPPDYVLQPYVEQRLYDIWADVDDEVRSVPMKVVGLLPSLDGQPLGPGIYRASQADVVNVAGGGTILVPVVATPRA